MASKFAVGGRVLCAAKQFGIQWAQDNFGKRWKTARVHGVVREVLGKRSYKVLYDGDPTPWRAMRSLSRNLEPDFRTIRISTTEAMPNRMYPQMAAVGVQPHHLVSR
jgi:hypothetical protein